MSEPLTAEINRLKVTDDTMLWLRWKSRITGKSYPELARETLHSVASREMAEIKHKHSILRSIEQGEGRRSDTAGTQGNSYPTSEGDD